MKKYILFILVVGLSFNACNNAFEREIGEVDSLLAIVNDTEKSLLNVDTSKVFSAKRQMEKDLAELNKIKDTLTKEEAFQMDDLFSSKKRIFRLTKNYSDFMIQINFSKDQLTNLKQDVGNNLMSKADFESHLENERTYVLSLNKKINKAVDGLDVALEKFRLFRPEIEKLIENRKHKSATE
jgi:hypothetical protein